jgi:hypothetical protein
MLKSLVISPSIKVSVIISTPKLVKISLKKTGKNSLMLLLIPKLHMFSLKCKPLMVEIPLVSECKMPTLQVFKFSLKKKLPEIPKLIILLKKLVSSF